MKIAKWFKHETRTKMLAVLVLTLVFGFHSAAFAQSSGNSPLYNIGQALADILADFKLLIPIIGVIVFIWAGIKVLSGQRDAIPWAIGALAGVVIALNADTIYTWLSGLVG
ncbi:TrbC/VirB2 family protein [bacterium]|nr:TrbC/VirB2 family protein [bacterium]